MQTENVGQRELIISGSCKKKLHLERNDNLDEECECKLFHARSSIIGIASANVKCSPFSNGGDCWPSSRLLPVCSHYGSGCSLRNTRGPARARAESPAMNKI